MKSSNLSSFLACFDFLETVDSPPKFDRLVVLNSASALLLFPKGVIVAEKPATDYLDCFPVGVMSTMKLLIIFECRGSMGGSDS